MTMTGEITIVREGWMVRAAIALTRWSRRRSVRADISEIYFGDDERRMSLEEQLLLDRERRAARQQLDRTIAMSRLYRGL
jgi:hypothetical protein